MNYTLNNCEPYKLYANNDIKILLIMVAVKMTHKSKGRKQGTPIKNMHRNQFQKFSNKQQKQRLIMGVKSSKWINHK